MSANSEINSLFVEKDEGRRFSPPRLGSEAYWKSVEGSYRLKWWQIWKPANPPLPPLVNMDDAEDIPFASASFISLLTFSWITPIMVLGWQRTLQTGDLWKMDSSRKAELLGSRLNSSWTSRAQAANDWNVGLDNETITPSRLRRKWWTLKARGDQKMISSKIEAWKKASRRAPSLIRSLNDVFGWEFWLGGVFKILGDVAQTCTPLVSKAIIKYSQEHYAATRSGLPGPSVGRGVGAAIGLFFLTILNSICQHQWFWRSMSTGVLGRAALINCLYTRGLSLTPKSRTLHSSGALVNHLSTDISRIDYLFQWFHPAWTAPVQVIICLIILCVQMGPSALAGFALFLILTPIQKKAMSYQLNLRRGSMKYTDQRATLLQEILGAMRITKLFTYEIPLVNRISSIRGQELKGIWTLLVMRAATQAVAFSIPVLASVLAFVVYALSGHSLDPAIIFTSLSLFNLLRQPLMFMPRSLSAITDGSNALSRLARVLSADTLGDSLNTDQASPHAVILKDADFQWEAAPPDLDKKPKRGGKSSNQTSKEKFVEAETQTPNVEVEPFCIRDINLTIPRGGCVYAIVGPVGAGKSSLVQALVGEMRLLKGQLTLGGSLAYCAQSPWIQNTTLRNNITFGRDFEEGRYWKAVTDASLITDLEILPDGDLTEIGEKGISKLPITKEALRYLYARFIDLSGGQKARVNLARALYSGADIIALDDPLSAVDAHVGEALFTNAILGLKARGKSVILVTHALHFLPQVDYIYNLSGGRIHEEGTYEELMKSNGLFSVLVRDFGNSQNALQANKDEAEISNEGPGVIKTSRGAAQGTGKASGALMSMESRKTGSISSKVYKSYISAGGGLIPSLSIIISATLMQVSQLLTSYWLVWWQDNTFHQPSGFYMGLYAGLGLTQATFTFVLGAAMSWLSFKASVRMHGNSLKTIIHAPMSFFDTTPLGRILGVFGKDMDTIDNTLSDSLRMLALTLSSLLGSIILITILIHYFLPIVVFIMLCYIALAKFYTVSSREMKRLDAILRSSLYSHFSESLSGLATIRAYGETTRFISENARFIDRENAALLLTVTNQRWLSVRLDAMGGFLTFIVALMAVFGVNGVSPAQIGVVLTYIVTITQILSIVTRQTAEVENNMNAVERVFQYSHEGSIPQEASYEHPDAPSSGWPTQGTVDFRDVVMSYRQDLPPVLKGISITVEAGQKIGVVGRTGAGKSSLMSALFRLIELSSGSIVVDGVDISTLGLRQLRNKISIIPQEPFIFSGTIRSNLDPFNQHDDARLWDALRRAHLLDSENSTGLPAEKGVSRFTLDTVIEPEGINLSVGERSLLSLARALCKENAKIVVMDEATASVDLETDSKIQDTILKEFQDRTILCIAHRLRTIISYQKILVLDQGEVREFDTPLALFDQEGGIFRSMCDRSNIRRKEIEATYRL